MTRSVITSSEVAFLDYLLTQWPAAAQLCVFDVGANVGEYTAAVLDRWPYAEVWAFEPQQAAYDAYVERHVVDQDHARVFAAHFGLSSMSGESTLRASDHGSCVLATLHDRDDADDYHGSGIALSRSERIQLERLDQFFYTKFLPQSAGERIHLLKLDVEGHEYDVMVGGAQTIASHVDLLQFEFNDAAAAARVTFDDIYFALRSAGYAAVFRLREHVLQRVTPADVDPDENENYVAVHRDCRWFTANEVR